MKKILFTILFSAQVALVLAADAPTVIAQPRQENVKMFLQPGTSAPVMEELKSSDHIRVVRRHNKNWDLVMVGDKAGYVLRSEIERYSKQKTAKR